MKEKKASDEASREAEAGRVRATFDSVLVDTLRSLCETMKNLGFFACVESDRLQTKHIPPSQLREEFERKKEIQMKAKKRPILRGFIQVSSHNQIKQQYSLKMIDPGHMSSPSCAIRVMHRDSVGVRFLDLTVATSSTLFTIRLQSYRET